MTSEKEKEWWHAAYMYSLYQIVFVVLILTLPGKFPEWFIDYIRASSLFIAIAWTLLYMLVGPGTIVSYYQRFIPWMPVTVLYMVDIGLHLIPALLMGIPRLIQSYFVAFALITVWYIFTRPMMDKVYGQLPVHVMDISFFVAVPIVAVVVMWTHYKYMAHLRR